MEWSLFLRGLVIGFSIAAPVGPIGVLCIRRTLSEGRLIGLLTGLGAATADAMYGLVAGFGLTVVSNFLVGSKSWLSILGGLFLCYLGIKTLIARPDGKQAELKTVSLTTAYFSTLFLTLTNPATILFFVAIFSGLGLAESAANYFSAATLVCGVFTGSASWWLILSFAASLFKERLSNKMIWVNRASGVTILIFGLLALFSVL